MNVELLGLFTFTHLIVIVHAGQISPAAIPSDLNQSLKKDRHTVSSNYNRNVGVQFLNNVQCCAEVRD